ncbi:hypothetical protein Avbf_13881 [Armadillidium vulgare]|nr:hypothetical protein Avbf_13881 [Armadillidium vulgare]
MPGVTVQLILPVVLLKSSKRLEFSEHFLKKVGDRVGRLYFARGELKSLV